MKQVGLMMLSMFPIHTQLRILFRNFSDINTKKIWAILFYLYLGILTELHILIAFIFFRQGKKKQIEQDPVFILGHWRSGTTWLHELMMHNARFVSPTTLECFRPYSFKFDRVAFKIIHKLHLADFSSHTRPMDNVVVTPDSPQEDEYAILAMGAPTTSRRVFFFNNYGAFPEYQGWDGLPENSVRKACRKWLWFLSCIQAGAPEKQLLLKSPHHSWCVARIRKLFPKAKFVLVLRKPEDVYASYQVMLKAYFSANSLSRSEPVVTPEEFMETYLAMSKRVLRDTADMPEHAFTLVRYEDLKKDTVGELSRIFRELGIENYQPAVDSVAQDMAAKPPYKSLRKGKPSVSISGPAAMEFRQRFGYVENTMLTQAAQ